MSIEHRLDGLVGWNYPSVNNSFLDVNTTDQSSSYGGIGKTTEGLKETWDFAGDLNDDTGGEDSWDIDERGQINDSYPYLTWTQDNEQDTIPPVATVSANKTSVSTGESVSFDASGSGDNVGIDSYEWDLGNGETKTGEQVNYTYDSAGNYTVTLTVEDEAGNSAEHTIDITVEESDDDGDGSGTPGFTIIALLVSLSFVVLYRYRKKRR